MIMVDPGTTLSLCIVLLLFHSTFQQPPEPEPEPERPALLQLRSSLGLKSKDWPIKANPCLIWKGVQCQNNRVVGINISGFKRTRVGTRNPQFAVEALANITLLTYFNASRFPLPGSIPHWFGYTLKSLQVLDLGFCSIVGAIPFSLGNLTNLRNLYLSGNTLTGMIPSALAQMHALSVLDLSHNSLTGSIPSSFSSLGNLTFLDMSSNFLSGSIPTAIGNLVNLQYLNLSRNALSSSIPAQLGALFSLIDLDLSFNSFSGWVPLELRGLRSLQKFVIANNLLTGSLSANLFSPLTQLQLIVINHNDFTGDFPDMLWSMPGLSFLDASANNFTGTLPNLTLNVNTTTAVFNLSQNLFYGDLSLIIGRFSSMDLSSNYFQGNVTGSSSSNATLNRNCLQNVANQRSVAECASFYANRSLTFDNFGLPNATRSPTPTPDRKRRQILIILVGVLGGIGFLTLLVVFLVLCILCTRKRGITNQRGTNVGVVPAGVSPPPPDVSLKFSSLGDAFTLQQILQATGDFSDVNLIKHGHSGDLFCGILEGGISVVIKRIDLVSVKKESHMLELDVISKISHPRLVPLLGHCLENENEKFLIYKYMPNGDLSASLFRKTSLVDDNVQSLDWITRLKIAIGAAESLSYLHHECTPPLVHRDVQASSILLDDKFEVRLGSLSEVCTQDGDAHQNRITRFLRLPLTSEQGTSGTPTATCAYDVYCFGKVLLELITGKLGISGSTSNATTKDWLEGALPYISIYDKELVNHIVDPSLIIDDDLLEEVWAMAIVARSCLNPKPSRRPLMRYVLKALENPLKVVREEHNTGSDRLRTTSSRASWNATLFGSWRLSTSDVGSAQAGHTRKGEAGSGDQNGGVDLSSSKRRQSNEIFPEPLDVHYVERLNDR